MRTLVITAGDTALPAELEDVIARGSTAVERRRAADVPPGAALPDADRVVLWSAQPDAGVTQLARRYAKAERKARKEIIVFVTATPGEALADLGATELFVWPQDQDRLTMAFMTGA